MNVISNLGKVDRQIRFLFALILLGNGLYFGWTWAIVVSVVLGLTVLIGFCPAYLPFGISTCGLPQQKMQ